MDLTEAQIKSFMANRRVRTGRDCRFRPGQMPANKGVKGLHRSRATEFTKGRRPWNWRPVGSVRVVGGYIEVKTADPKEWKMKHVLVWEKKNGKVPKGSVVIFADGDKTNCRLKNLLLVSRRELSMMNHLGLIYGRADFTKTGKLIADVKLAVADRRQKSKGDKGVLSD